MSIHQDAQTIIRQALKACLPDQAVRRALEATDFGPGQLYLVAAGKAAWQMAAAACDFLGEVICAGIVITKYSHVKGPLAACTCCEGGHPIPDGNSFRAARAALPLVENRFERDTVLFLLSGGGSALFELPLISGKELQDITSQLLASGVDIVEMNTN